MSKYPFSSLIFNSYIDDAPPPYVCYLPNYIRHSVGEYEAARASIEQVSFVEPNWDGYGAAAISNEAENNAKVALDLLEFATHAPAVTPNSNGTLSFEWETDRGIGQLEIGRTLYSFYVRPNGGGAILFNGDARDVNRVLGGLVEEVLFPKESQSAFRPVEFGR